MLSPRLLLLVLGVLLLAGAGGGAWYALRPVAEDPAAELLPLPPEPARLADGPEYERCLDMLRRDPDGAAAYADAWDATGGGEGARHCAALAQLALGEPERAAERLEVLAARSRGSAVARAAVYAQAGQAWLMADKADRAFAAATLALSLTPNDVDLLVDRSIALGSLGRYAEALADLDRAVNLDSTRAEVWVFRAAAARHLDRVDQAQAHVAQALSLAPDNAEALLERGIIRQMRGDAAGARADWERAVALSPDSPTADLAQQNLALNEAGPVRR